MKLHGTTRTTAMQNSWIQHPRSLYFLSLMKEGAFLLPVRLLREREEGGAAEQNGRSQQIWAVVVAAKLLYVSLLS
jgi:hypothetical protein